MPYNSSAAAEGREASGSVPGIYTAQIMAGTPQPDPTVCKCGRKLVFCPDATCLNTHCVPCSKRAPWDDHSDFVHCSLDVAIKNPRTRHHCCVKGVFCKDHADKHLQTCQECTDKVCSLEVCHNCYGSFCDNCLSQDDIGFCLFCQKQWAETYANLESCSTNSGFESEDDFEDESEDDD